jgi:hypothetical protein
MPSQPITINLDRMVDAMLDMRTPHYWDPKRSRLTRGAGELDDDGKTQRVLIDTIGNRKIKRITDGFAQTLDPKDAKLVQDAVKAGGDKFVRLLTKREDLKAEWFVYAGENLMEAAIDWLAMQGVDEFIAEGEIAKFALEAAEIEELEEDEDDDDDEEEESEEEDEEDVADDDADSDEEEEEDDDDEEEEEEEEDDEEKFEAGFDDE